MPFCIDHGANSPRIYPPPGSVSNMLMSRRGSMGASRLVSGVSSSCASWQSLSSRRGTNRPFASSSRGETSREVRFVEFDDSGFFTVRGRLDLAAPPDLVYGMLSDYNDCAGMYHNIQSSTVEAVRGQEMTVAQVRWRMPHAACRIRGMAVHDQGLPASAVG